MTMSGRKFLFRVIRKNNPLAHHPMLLGPAILQVSILALMLCVVSFLHGSYAMAQGGRVSSLILQQGNARITLAPPVLAASTTMTLVSGSQLLLETDAWQRGGQSLLPGGGSSVGSSDASTVQVITAGVPRVTLGSTGRIGIGGDTVGLRLATWGGLTLEPPAVHNVDTDGAAITVGNRSFIEIRNPAGGTFNDAVFVTLTNGLTAGQLLFLTGNDTRVRLQSTDVNLSLAGNANRALGGAPAPRGTIVLIWDGTVWRELCRSNNTTP